MNLKRYLNSLLPSFEKARLLNDIRMLREELENHTLPPYANAAKALGARRTFFAKDVQAFDKAFASNVRTRARGNFVVVTNEVLKNTRDLLNTLEKLADKAAGRQIVVSGLNYHLLSVLRLVETTSFVARYSRKLLLWTLAAETNVMENRTDEIGRELTRAEQDWMRVHQEGFFQALTLLANQPLEIEKSLGQIPDMVADPENSEAVQGVVGLSRLDPLKLGLIPIAINPIYHIRIAVAEWQVARYKAAQEEKRALEFRLLRMREAEAGNPADAKLQEHIEYTEARLEKLNYRLAKMEEKYA